VEPVVISVAPDVAPFPAWTITLPAPLAFPREPFAAALAEHARLLQEHAERLLLLSRELATSQYPPLPVVDLAAVIAARPDAEAEVRVEQRGDIAHYVAHYRGVLRPLLFRSEAPQLPIVVIARGAISLHVATIAPAICGDRAPHRLVVDPACLAVEPLVQEHRTSDLGPLLVTRWMHPDREARYAWVTIPPEPESDEEATDRVLGHYGPLAQERLRTFLSVNARAVKPIVLVMSVPDYGDGVHVTGADELSSMRDEFPAILHAIDAHRDEEYVPVLVFMGKKAALRWTARREGLDRQEPPHLVESLRLPAKPLPDEAGASDAVPNAKAPRRRSDREVWEAIERMACFDEVDSRLGSMTQEQLDGEIAKVGFDPKKESAQGPGLRESILNAIVVRQLKDHPPDGIELKTGPAGAAAERDRRDAVPQSTRDGRHSTNEHGRA
jgi:hypothetical protein